MDTTLSALLGRVRGARGPPATAAVLGAVFFGPFMFERPGWASSIKVPEQERKRENLTVSCCEPAGGANLDTDQSNRTMKTSARGSICDISLGEKVKIKMLHLC